MRCEPHVRFCESLGVKLPGATHPLARTQPMLPLAPSIAMRRMQDYERNGTTTLSRQLKAAA